MQLYRLNARILRCGVWMAVISWALPWTPCVGASGAKSCAARVLGVMWLRLPPSPPDKRKGLPKGSPFLLSGAGHDARFARRPTRCVATRGPLPLPASPRPCRGSPSTEGLASPDGSGRGCGIDDFLVSAGIEEGCRKAPFFFHLARDATRVSRVAPHVAPPVARWVHPRTAWKARPFAQGGDPCPVRMACAQNV